MAWHCMAQPAPSVRHTPTMSPQHPIWGPPTVPHAMTQREKPSPAQTVPADAAQPAQCGAGRAWLTGHGDSPKDNDGHMNVAGNFTAKVFSIATVAGATCIPSSIHPKMPSPASIRAGEEPWCGDSGALSTPLPAALGCSSCTTPALSIPSAAGPP